MFHCVFAISLFLQTSPDTKEIGEWGRTITEVYMTWYTFFVTANLLVMGWFYSKDVSNHKPLIPVSLLFLCLDILGAFSTGLVGYYMAKEVPADFRGLVAWAAGVTAVGATVARDGLFRICARPLDAVQSLLKRHPERVLGRGSVALPASLLRLLRALSPQQVACLISALLRLRYAGQAQPGESAAEQGAGVAHGSLIDPDRYPDCKELAGGDSRASQEAFAQLAGFSADRIAELADALLLAQPQLCATFLLDGGFLHGQVPAQAAARRVFRDIHAVHRESLVVYPG